MLQKHCFQNRVQSFPKNYTHTNTEGSILLINSLSSNTRAEQLVSNARKTKIKPHARTDKLQ